MAFFAGPRFVPPAGPPYALASEISQVESENFTVTGAVRPAKTSGKEARPVYEFLDEQGNVYKLIGPKAIVDQLLAVKGYDRMKFSVSGQLIKSVKDKKKGILMSGFEIYAPPAAPAAPASSSTAETSLKKDAPPVPAAGTVEAGIR